MLRIDPNQTLSFQVSLTQNFSCSYAKPSRRAVFRVLLQVFCQTVGQIIRVETKSIHHQYMVVYFNVYIYHLMIQFCLYFLHCSKQSSNLQYSFDIHLVIYLFRFEFSCSSLVKHSDPTD